MTVVKMTGDIHIVNDNCYSLHDVSPTQSHAHIVAHTPWADQAEAGVAWTYCHK